MSILNAQILTLANPAVWREKLGLETMISDLQAQVTALTDRVAVLETSLDQAEAAVVALRVEGMNRLIYSPADGLTYEVRMQNVGGTVSLDWKPYPLQLVLAGGAVTLGDVPAACALGAFDRIPGADGLSYTLSVVEMSGVKTLDWEAAL